MKKLLYSIVALFIFILAAPKNLSATHIMGGEITWECQSNGEYKIILKTYRDCELGNAVGGPTEPLRVHNYPNVGAITNFNYSVVSNTDITPQCGSAGLSLSCANRDGEAVFEYVREVTVRLNGTPPPEGWIITYDQGNRNGNDNIVNSRNEPITLRAIIYPHSGTVADTCVDNSPKFRETATSLLCLGTSFTYNHNATDDELDSLVYDWAYPLTGMNNTTPFKRDNPNRYPARLQFLPGFSVTSPFPSQTQDPRNVPATLDRQTGEITMTSYTSGKYVSVINVSAYKCGEKVAEIYRELQSNIAASCSQNQIPTIIPPFNNQTDFDTSIRAGDAISFNIQVTDFPGPNNPNLDSVFTVATGLQWGANFTNPNSGCLNPPCATVDYPFNGTKRLFADTTRRFFWQTDCNHVAFSDGCVSLENTYTFVIRAQDNACPIPGQNIATISITVLADSVIESPRFNCVDVLPNGDVQLDWNTTPDPNNSFSAWMIYSATNVNGPYTLVDSIKTYNQTTFTHSGANANTQRRFYYIRSRSGCKGIVQNVAKDTVSTIFVQPTLSNTCVGINWNALSSPNPAGSASSYRIFKEYPIGSGFNLLQTSASTSFCDNFTACEDSVAYRIELLNTTEGCTSRSNVVGFRFDRKPNPDFSFPVANCSGSVSFTNLTSAQGGNITYTWDFGDGSPTSSLTNPIHTFTGPGPFNVTLTARTGANCDSSVTKQVLLGPDVDAGPDVAICPGGSVGIGGAPTTSTLNPTFQWSPTTGLNNASVANPTASPTVTTTYTVTVTDANSCTNTDQVVVNVNPTPFADAGSDRTICNGTTTVIGGAPTGPGGATYSWDNATSLNDPTIANPTASPTVTTTYSVTVSSGANCSAVDQITISVNPAPNVDAGADRTICNSGSVQIGGAPTSSTAGATFAWDNAATLNNATSANPTANPTTTTTYTVTVTHPNGCTATDQMIVNVNALPVADAGADQTICNGQSATLGGSPTGPTGATFSWDNAASLSSSTVANPVATPTVTTTYTVTVTDANGCVDTDAITITVNPLPNADAGADQTICNLGSIQIGGAPTSSTAGATFAWDNAATLDNATLANPTANPTVTTTYTVTVTHPNGCTASDQVVVNVNNLPSIDAGADQGICIGGSATIGGTPTGPAGSTFAWDNAATLSSSTAANPVATPTATTTYTVTVTDGNGCTGTDAVTITVNPLPTADAGADQTICNGQSTTLGGTPTGPAGSSFAWDNAATLSSTTAANPVATPSATTTYTVTVTDGSGCVNTDQVTITVDPLPNVDAGADQAICNGGSVQIGGAPTSSTVGATFAWDNAASLDNAAIANPTANPTTTTTYTVTVTHPNGCTATDQMVVNVSTLPTADAGADQTICNGQSATLGGSPTGPAGATYAWDNAATLDNATIANPTASPSTTTTYTVTVTDAAGCTNTDDIVITVNSLPTADAGADQTICNGGSVQIGGAPTGPVGSTFAWDNTATLDNANLANPTASPTTTTTYTVTVTDVNGCSTTDQITVTVDPLPSADAGSDQTICDGGSVQIGGAPTSATIGATFAWDNAASLDNASLANPTASPTTTTTYTVTVTHPNGCTATDQMIVNVNSLPTADAGTDQTLCAGQSVTIGGSPTGPLGSTFAWDNVSSLSNSTTANPVATPTATTTYSVTVTDISGCTAIDDVTITVDPVPNVDAGINRVICNGGTVQIGGAPTSSTAGATFAWDNTATLDNATLANPTANPTVTTTYTVTVTHPNGCTATDQMVVNVNTLPSIDAGADQAICIGGSATLGGSPTGPAGSTFAWDNAASLSSSTVANPVATPTATTTYTVTVTDGNGCTGTDAITITVNPLPTADAGADQTICNGQSATLGGSPTGPAGSAFVWDNSATLSSSTAANPVATPSATTTYTVTVTDVNGCINTDAITITVDPLPNVDAGADQAICNGGSVQIGGAPTSSTAGATYAWDNAASLDNAAIANPTANPTTTTTYTVTVTHPNGCTATDQVVVNVNALPVVDAGADQTICNGQSATLGGSPTGPTGATYAWDNAATLSSSTVANPVATPTATTTYTVTVTDANGCVDTDAITITVDPLPNVDAGADQTICNLGSIQIGGAPTSSTTGATFAWDNAATLDNATIANPTANPTTTTTYTVTVTHPNGCTATDQVVVNVNALPTVDAGADQGICIGGSATLGGAPTGPAGSTFAWDNATTLSSSTAANPVATPTTTTTYTVTVTDGNGCTDTDAITITVNPLPIVNAGVDQTICNGFTAALGGGPTGPAGSTFAWDNAATLSSATVANPTATPTATTTYTVTVTDPNGCVNTDDVTITVNPLPNVDAGADQTICNGGSVQIGGAPTSSTAGATFAWDNSASLDNAAISNPTANPTTTTTYTVTVTHPNGCTATDQVVVNVNALPTADAGADQAVCIGSSATLGGSPTGPAGSTFAWDNAASLSSSNIANPIATPTVTTTYTVTVTDAAGCTDTDDIVITVNPLPSVDAGNDQTICDGGSVQIGGAPTSSAAGATFAWDNASTLSNATIANPTASPTTTTTYTVTVTDGNGCINTDQIVVTVNPLPNIDAGSDQTICDGGAVQIGGAPTSSTVGATFAWDNAATLDNATLANPTANPTSTTTYTVTVTHPNGCTVTDQMVVNVNPLPTADAGPDQTICGGLQTVIGGTPTGPAGSTYAWDNAASLSSSTAANPVATPTANTTYTVTVTDINGCTATDQITINVNAAPFVDAGADFTICERDSIMIGGSPSGPSGATFQWTPTAGLSDPTAANPMASPSDTTQYVLTVSDGVGCTATDTMIVNVNPSANPDFRVDQLCISDLAAFSDLSTLSVGTITSWRWDFDDAGATSSLQNPAHQYSTAGTYNVKLVVTTSLGCLDSIIKPVTINPLPVTDAGPDVNLCLGDSIQIGGSPSSATGVTFNWSPAIGLSDVTSPNPMAFPTASTSYSLIVTDANGCVNYDTMEVTVNPLPVIDAGSDTAVCSFTPLQLNASGAVSYSWSPTTYLDNPAIANPIATVQKSISYIVTGTDANGCSSTDTINVEVFNLDFNPTDTSVCFRDSVELNPDVSGNLNGITYTWTPNIGISNTKIRNPKVSPPIDMEYKLRITNSIGCIDIDSITVDVNATANVNFNMTNSLRCSGSILEIENTSNNTDRFIWKVNGVERSRAFNPSLDINYQDTNRITLIGFNSLCTDSITKVLNPTTPQEILKFNGSNVFTPNGDGINDIFDPGFNGEFIGCAEFQIFDRWGEKVFDSNIGQYGWDGITIGGQTAKEGVYFYVIKLAELEIKGSVFLSRSK